MLRDRRLVIGVATVGALVAVVAVWLSVQLLSGQDNGDYVEPVIPEFSSWSEMQTFIEQRHARMQEFARRHPEETLHVAFTPTRALTIEDVQTLGQQYHVTPYYVEFQAGSLHGVLSLSPSVTLETLEQEAYSLGTIRNDECLQMTYVAISGRAQDLASMSDDPLTALVDATNALDLREGLRPRGTLVNPQRSVFRDYQRLAPGGAGDVGYGTPWPLSTPSTNGP